MSISDVLGSNHIFNSQLYDVAINADAGIEGGVVALFFGLEYKNITSALHEKKSLQTDPKKSEKIWAVNKKLILSSFSLSSAVALVVNWMNKVRIITLGALAPLVGFLGYVGYGGVYVSRMWDTLKELGKENFEWSRAKDPIDKQRHLFKQGEVLIKCAIYASLLAWSILGIASVAIGGARLIALSADALKCSFTLFLGYIGYNLLYHAQLKK